LDRVHADDRVEHSSEAFAADLISLVGDIAARAEPYAPGAANRYVNAIFDHAWESGAEGALWEMLPRDECLRYAAPNEAITLSAARRIAFRLDARLVELLSGSPPVTVPLGFGYSADLPATMTSARRARTAGRAALRRQLKAVIECQTEPQSLRAVARQLGVSVGALRYHCPELVEIVVRRRQAFQQSTAVLTRIEASAVVKKAIAEWPLTAPEITKKALLRKLFPHSGLPKNLLRAEIQAQWEPPHLS
jgi:hypothetical protein